MSTPAPQNYNYGVEDFLPRAKNLCADFQFARQRSVIATRPSSIEFVLCRIDVFEESPSVATPLVRDYEWLQFHDEYISISELFRRFELFRDRKFCVNTFEVPLTGVGFHDSFLPGGSGYSDFPGTLFEIALGSRVQLGHQPLLHIDHPSYRSPYDAIGAFTELPEFGAQSDGRIGEAVFFVPGMSASIADIKLIGSTLTFQLAIRKSLPDIRLKIAYSIGNRKASTSADVRNSTVEVPLDFVPTELDVWLLSASRGLLDSHREDENSSTTNFRLLPKKATPAALTLSFPSDYELGYPFTSNTPSNATDRDDLLPVLRRKAFDSQITQFFETTQTDGKPLSVLMIDLDRFKKVNDEHGHQVGDEVLVECSRVIDSAVQHKGRVYRYGGEEIVVLLPNFSSIEAAALAERIRTSVVGQKVTSKKLNITISVGVATFPEHADTMDGLIKEADRALYKAKELGRDLVRISGDQQTKRAAYVPPRKEPSPGILDPELIRQLYFSGHEPKCPVDGVALRISETHRSGNRTPDLNVSCPLCGLQEHLKAPV